MKTEEQIREVLAKLFQNPFKCMFDVFIARTLKWVLGDDDEFLDYLLERDEDKAGWRFKIRHPSKSFKEAERSEEPTHTK